MPSDVSDDVMRAGLDKISVPRDVSYGVMRAGCDGILVVLKQRFYEYRYRS